MNFIYLFRFYGFIFCLFVCKKKFVLKDFELKKFQFDLVLREILIHHHRRIESNVFKIKNSNGTTAPSFLFYLKTETKQNKNSRFYSNFFFKSHPK